jgi:protein pelota
MKILNSNTKTGSYKLQIQNQDDLWYLSQIIDINDIVKSKSLRKIKSSDSEKSTSVTRKPVLISLIVEKITYEKDSLRVLGIIKESTSDDVSHGSHHSFNLEDNSILTIIKQKWYGYQLDKLKESSKQKKSKILVCVFDREDACIALIKKYGFDILTQFSGTVEKKYDSTTKNQVIKPKVSFYEQIIFSLQEYAKRLGTEHIIIASPAFFKDDLMKELKDDKLKKSIILATCNSVGSTGISEVLKRPEVKEVLKQERAAKESLLVEQLLHEISKKGLASYGFKETKSAIEAGAVDTLLVTDSYIFKLREQENFSKLDTLLKQVDQMKGKIHIISSEHEAGNKLDGLGGIASLLRYQLNY